jgi:membrane protein DedA with SNARE-associated domain
MTLAEWWQNLPNTILAFVDAWGIVAFGVTLMCLVIRCAILPGSLIPAGTMIFSTGIVAVRWPIAWTLLGVLALATASAVGCWVGYHLAQRILAWPKAPKWMRPDAAPLEKASKYFERAGTAGTAFAVSQPWLCSISPYVAVKLGLGERPFVMGSALGSLLWVVVIFTLGSGAGYATQAAAH